MDIIEPIDLLKNELKRLNKAIDKCTVANYNTVTTNLNPWIEKYEKAIKELDLRNKIKLFKDNMEIEFNCRLEAISKQPNRDEIVRLNQQDLAATISNIELLESILKL